MAAKQKITCTECHVEFEFDPDEKVITSLNESLSGPTRIEKEVTAYLECPKGHVKAYKIKKNY